MKVVKSRAFKDRLKGHKQSVIALFSPYGPEGHILYSVSRDGSMRGWDLVQRSITIKLLLDKVARSKQEKEQEEREMEAKQVKQAKQAKQAKETKQTKQTKQTKEEKTGGGVIVGTTNGKVREQIVNAVFSQKFLFGSYQDGTINQWSFSNQGQIVRAYNGHTKKVSSLALVQKKQILISASHDSTIRTWNIETGQSISVYKTSGPVHCLRIGEDTGHIQAIVNRNILYEINMQTNGVVKCIKFQRHSITNFYFKDDLMVFGDIENKLLVYNLSNYDPQNQQVKTFLTQKLVPLKVIQGIAGWALTLQFDNDQLFIGSDDRKIRVYKYPEIIQVEELAGHDDGIVSLSFADKMLYSGSYDHSIRSWDLREMGQRILERDCLAFEDVESKKYEVYYGVVFKKKKKKLPAKKKK